MNETRNTVKKKKKKLKQVVSTNVEESKVVYF